MDHLNVEVFRDKKTPCADPRFAVHGFNYVNNLTKGKLTLVDGSREIDLTENFPPAINSEETRHLVDPLMAMRVIMTERPVNVPDVKDALGYSYYDRQLGAGIAVISTYGQTPLGIRLTVAHEIGHLLDLRYKIDEDTTALHCSVDSCLMSPHVKNVQYQGTHGEYSIIENQTFCTDCSKKLGGQALNLIEYRKKMLLAAH